MKVFSRSIVFACARFSLLISVVALLFWTFVWWVPEPFGSMTVEQYHAKSAAWRHRDSDACRLSSVTLVHLADGVDLHFPDADCGWTPTDLALARQAARVFRDQVANDLGFYDNPKVGVPPPSVGIPRYAILRTRASVVVGWVGNEVYGGARCYFRRTIKGWQPLSCSRWMA